MEAKEDKFIGRTRARSRAVDVLFEADQKKLTRPPSLLLGLLEDRKTTSASKGSLPEYSARIVEGFATNQREIDALLDRHIRGTTLDRIPSVDRAVLRVAAWELLYNQEEVPPISAIDEAIKVAKPVATDETPDFLNGVLDALREGLEDPWGRRAEAADPSNNEAVEGVAIDEEDSDEAGLDGIVAVDDRYEVAEPEEGDLGGPSAEAGAPDSEVGSPEDPPSDEARDLEDGPQKILEAHEDDDGDDDEDELDLLLDQY